MDLAAYTPSLRVVGGYMEVEIDRVVIGGHTARAELHVFEAATHTNFFACPESDDFNRELRRFLDARWKRGQHIERRI